MIHKSRSSSTNNIVRKVKLITDPTTFDLTGIPMVAAADYQGFSHQIALDSLPAGITLDMIKSGQNWYVERRTGYDRLSMYIGELNPYSQLRASTAGLTLTNASVYTNVPFTSNITVQSGSCGVTVYSGGQFTVPIPGLYSVSWSTTVSNGGNTRLYSTTLNGYYPTGTTGIDVLCLTSGNLSFSIQSEAPYSSTIPGAVLSGGWVSISYVGSVS